jgi:hypothetical protein
LLEMTKNQPNGEQGSELVIFDDENNQNELVYGIVIDRARQSIHVGFRGSATIKGKIDQFSTGI